MTSPSSSVERPADEANRWLVGLARSAAGAYIAATLLGVWMRFELIGISFGPDFDHILHAHSHTLYFGWAALGLLAAASPAFQRVTMPMRWSIVALVLAIPLLFFGFLATGYHPFTIAVSTGVMAAWYVVAIAWWRQLSHMQKRVSLAFRYGLLYLAASSIGIWVLAIIQASGGSAFAEELAIHAFLLGFGWFFVFMVVGAIILHRHRLGLSLDPRVVAPILHFWAVAAWATFPLGVVGGPEVWVLGPIARVAGLAVVVPGVWWVSLLWRVADPGPMQLLHRLAALWFGVATVATAVVASLGSSVLLAGGRQGVVIYLHALFVGFVTPLLATLLSHRLPIVALRVHHAALGVMLIGLSVVAVGYHQTGMWMALVGAVALWLAGVGWSWPIIRGPDWTGAKT